MLLPNRSGNVSWPIFTNYYVLCSREGNMVRHLESVMRLMIKCRQGKMTDSRQPIFVCI